MLNYLRIFSWFLFTFGVVGFVVILTGLAPGIGSIEGGLGLMGLQTVVGGTIVYGFRRLKAETLDRKILLYGGWALVIMLIIIGQVWVNQTQINL